MSMEGYNFRDATGAATHPCPIVRAHEFTELPARLHAPRDESPMVKLPPVLPDCYRSACRQPNATWYNSSTREWYCRSCALKINEFNPGLCVEGTA